MHVYVKYKKSKIGQTSSIIYLSGIKVNSSTTKENFHRTVSVPFLEALTQEMQATFNMSSIGPIEALLAVDPASIPNTSKISFKEYGVGSLKTAFKYYGNNAEDT